MMKTLAVATVGAAFAMGGAAHAADLYTGGGLKDGPFAVPVANTWAGFYIGTNGGGAWAANPGEFGIAVDGTTAPTPEDPDGEPIKGNCGNGVGKGGAAGAGNNTNGQGNSCKDPASGAFGGGQLGYNIQRGNIVLGVEGDIQYAKIHDMAAGTVMAGTTVGAAIGETNLDWFGTIRGRLGYSFGRTLVYATGGFAFGGVRDSLQVTDYETLSESSATKSVSRNATATGYTVGGGFEYALTPEWSLKSEYQYLDLGSHTLQHSVSATDSDGDTTEARFKINHDYHTVRAGVNYHVSTPYEPLK